MKRLLMICLVTIMSIALLSACSSNTSSPSSNNTSSNEKKSEEITIWTNFQVEAELLQQYADKWSEETGNKATVIHNSIELQQFAQATNTANGPDGIFGIANDQLASFVTANLVAETPSDLYNDNDYVDASIQASYIDGKRFGLPIAVETITLFYNTDKLSTPPATWDELLTDAKDNGGIKFDAKSIYYDYGFVRAFDGYIFNWENNSYNVADIGLGNSGAIQAYQYIQKLVDEGFISSDITFDIARGSFENGETAFYIGGPWDVSAFSSAGLNFAVAPMPTLNDKPFTTPVGTQVAFVSAKSKKQNTVWEFYQYLEEQAATELYNVGGRIPAKLANQNNIETDEVTDSFIVQISNGEPLPSVPELGQLWGLYNDNMSLMFGKKTTPEETAKNIETQFVEAIELMHSGL